MTGDLMTPASYMPSTKVGKNVQGAPAQKLQAFKLTELFVGHRMHLQQERTFWLNQSSHRALHLIVKSTVCSAVELL